MTGEYRVRRSTGELPWSILARPLTRSALAVLTATDEPCERSTLAEAITETPAARPSLDSEPCDRDVEVYLHHSVLPKLDAHGLLEYDPVNGTVECEDLPITGDEWLEPTVIDDFGAFEYEP